jgi:hypothetical protein
MKLLIVAPESSIDAVAELIAAVGAGRADILYGIVPGREVIQRIRAGSYTALLIVAHGNRDALAMSDGLLNAALLEEAIRSAGGLRLVMLAACESIGPAAEIYIGGVSYAIGWAGQVDDDVARAYGVTFWNSYKLSRDPHAAHANGLDAVAMVDPHHHPPILLNGRSEGYQRQINDMLSRRVDKVADWQRWIMGLGIGIAALVLIDILLKF